MRKILALILVVSLIPFVVNVIPEKVYGMTGTGSIADPYMIYNVSDLDRVRDDVYNVYYELANDINATETSTWNGGAGFEPICNHTTPFQAFFDGNGYSITGLYINRATTDRVGLFGEISGAAVDAHVVNVILDDFYIHGSDDVGCLVGEMTDVDISYVYAYNCSVDGELTGVDQSQSVGGLVGTANGPGDIEYCGYNGTIVCDGGYRIGGITGYAYNSDTGTALELYRCWVRATITGTPSAGYPVEQIGGVVGTVDVSGSPAKVIIIDQCYSEGSITTSGWGPSYYTDYNGGLLGYCAYHTSVVMTDCYSRMDVLTPTSPAYGGKVIGGAVGEIGGTVSRCYSTGEVTGYENVGGFAGGGCSGAGSSFWDKETSAQTSSACGTGHLTSVMQTESTYTNAGWDFDDVWEILPIVNDGYPFLQFNTDFYQAVWYQPIDIIHGTVLPDRAGYQHGNITWGVNPVEVGVSSLYDEYSAGNYTWPFPSTSYDMIGPSGQPEWTREIPELVANPFYPLVNTIGTQTGIPNKIVWVILATLLLLLAMLVTYRYAPHQIITAMVGGGIASFWYAMGIYPFWVIFIFVLMALAIIIGERSPTV